MTMLQGTTWIGTSYKSFIECFGYMAYLARPYVYKLYPYFFLDGSMGFIYCI